MPSHSPPDFPTPSHDDPGNGDTSFPGSEYLAHGSPRQILRRLSHNDPLDIYVVTRERLESRAILIDDHRVTLRAFARTAYRASTYNGNPPLRTWLAERVDEAIDDLVREDADDEAREAPCKEPWDERYSFIAESIGAQPSVARTMCVRFNRLDRDVRHAFYHLFVLGKTIHRYVAEGNGPPARVRELLARAADAFRDAGPPPVDRELDPREILGHDFPGMENFRDDDASG